MTNILEKTIQSHKEAVKEYGVLDDNLFYSVLHTDGKVTHLMSRVCFAALYYCFSNGERTEEFVTEENITHVILHPYSSHINPKYTQGEELLRYEKAVQWWCELFSPFVEYRDDAIIVDVCKGETNAVGAFLVGFRNLSEQSTYVGFLSFIENGFGLHEAAYLSQVFQQDHVNGDWTPGVTYHRINHTEFWQFDEEIFYEQVKTCVLFDQDQMVGQKTECSTLSWSIGRRFYNSHSDGDLKKTIEKDIGVKRADGSWGGTYIVFTTEQLMPYLKGKLNG